MDDRLPALSAIAQNLIERLSCRRRGDCVEIGCPKKGKLITPTKVVSFWWFRALKELRDRVLTGPSSFFFVKPNSGERLRSRS
jgi:hypothetical protein